MVKQKRIRSPRFSVPNNEEAVVSIGSEKYRGALFKFCHLPGGAIRLDRQIASGTLGDIGINTVSGSCSSRNRASANGEEQSPTFPIHRHGADRPRTLGGRIEEDAWTGTGSREDSTGPVPKPGTQCAFPFSKMK